MRQNATDESEPDDLPPTQERVVAALITGSTVTRAAELAGVDRTTVHRWLRNNWDFQAALNRARREFRDSLGARLENIAERAIQTVDEAIGAGDVRVALAVLKGLGLLDGCVTAIGVNDAATLREETELERKQVEADRRLRSLTVFG